jgi:DNA-binding transcriptional ArsR family regulator
MRPIQENDVFHAIAHPARRTILVLLKDGEKRASDLASPFGVSFSAISQHLKILKDADLVSERRDGRSRIYHLNSGPLKELRDLIEHFQIFWNERLDALEEHLDKKQNKSKPSVAPASEEPV